MAESIDKTTKKRKGIAGIFPANPVYKIIIIVMLLLAIAFLAMMAVFNAFPTDMTMTLIVVMLVMLALAMILLARNKRWLRVLGLFIAVLFLAGYGLGTYYLGSTYAAFAKISADNESKTVAGADVTREPFNVYITGIDQWNYEKGYDLERSDVNMIITVNPQTRKVLLTSIPRDAYVKLHTAQQMDKLTHTGVYGVDETINTVQDWLGIDLKYYVKVNFTSVVKVINAIGGIKVYSPTAFHSSISKHSYVKGWNKMSGKQALYFARERKAFEGKDDQRVDNQQRVMEAMLNRLLKSETLLTKYDDLLDIAASDLETDMSMEDMQALVKMQLSDLSAWDIEVQKITGEYDMDYVASLTQDQKFQVYRTDDKSVAACLDNIDAVMNPTEAEIKELEETRKKTNFINFIRKLVGGDSSESTEETEG